METTEQENKSEQPKILRTCALPGCGNQFEPSNNHHMYCCENHKVKASRNKKKTMGNIDDSTTTESADTKIPEAQTIPTPSPFTKPKESRDIAIPNGISDSARFIIDNLREQRDDWKREWNDEREARKKLMNEHEALEKKHRDFVHETELKSIRESKSTLQGLADSGVMQFLGPAIQEFSMGMAKAASSKMAGIMPGPGNLQGTSAEIMSAFAAWLPNLSEDTQQKLWSVLQSLIQLDEQSAANYLINFLNLIQNGTTARTASGWN